MQRLSNRTVLLALALLGCIRLVRSQQSEPKSEVVPATKASDSTASTQPNPILDPATRILVTIASGGHTPATVDFAAIVDHQPAQIVRLIPAKDDQLIFAVLVDASGNSLSKVLGFEKKASVVLFQALSTGRNVGYFGDYAETVTLQESPATISGIHAALRGITTAHTYERRSALSDAVFKATQVVAKAPGQPTARRAVFVLTGADDEASRRTLKDAIQASQEAGVAVYCVGLGVSKKAAAGMRTLSALLVAAPYF